MHPADKLYLLSQIDPFNPAVLGARVPDTYSFPTATLAMKGATQQSGVSAGGTLIGAIAFNPWADALAFNPASITAPGVITWTGGTSSNYANYSGFSNVAESYRVVGWGLRITTDTGLTSTNGHLWVSHLPQDITSDAFGYTQFPTTESQFAAYPVSEKYSLVELCERPLLVAGRRVDDSSLRFRDVTYPSNASPYAETNTGWATILLYWIGTTTPTINVEYIIHVEYCAAAKNADPFGATMFCPPNQALYSQGIVISQAMPVARIADIADEKSGESLLQQSIDMASNLIDSFQSSTLGKSLAEQLEAAALGSFRDASTSYLKSAFFV